MFCSFEMSQPLNCCFCGRGDENEVEFGKIYTIDDVSVHYYCLVSSFAEVKRSNVYIF